MVTRGRSRYYRETPAGAPPKIELGILGAVGLFKKHHSGGLFKYPKGHANVQMLGVQ